MHASSADEDHTKEGDEIVEKSPDGRYSRVYLPARTRPCLCRPCAVRPGMDLQTCDAWAGVHSGVE